MNTRWQFVEKLNEKKFLRLTGVRRFVFEEMVTIIKESEEKKFKQGGRPPNLIVEDQILLLLQYYRDYRPLYSTASIYNVSEPTAWRIVVKIEKALISSGRFSIPGKKECLNQKHEHILVDVTESPIERPKKNVAVELKTLKRIFTQERRKNTR